MRHNTDTISAGGAMKGMGWRAGYEAGYDMGTYATSAAVKKHIQSDEDYATSYMKHAREGNQQCASVEQI